MTLICPVLNLISMFQNVLQKHSSLCIYMYRKRGSYYIETCEVIIVHYVQFVRLDRYRFKK